MNRPQIIEAIEAQQEIQMANPPSSAAWIAASVELNRLVSLLTGKQSNEAYGSKICAKNQH